MPAAVAIPLIVGGATAGATIYAANKGAGAATGAAQTQVNAANQGAQYATNAVNQTVPFYNQALTQSQSNLSPYVQLGNAALSSLGQMHGVNGQSLLPHGSIPPPTGQPAAGLQRPPQMSPLQTPPPIPGGSDQSQGVLLEAPNGQRKVVPPDQVQHYVSQGAKVVPNVPFGRM